MSLKNLWRLLKRFTRPYRRSIALILGLQLVVSLTNLLLPSINADIIDRGVVLGNTRYILEQGGWMLLASFINVLANVYAIYLGARTAMAFGRDMRSAMFHHVNEFSAHEVASFGAPSLITRNTNDVQQVQMALMMTFSMLVSAPLMMAGGMIMAVREDVGLSWLVVVAVPLLAAGIALIVMQMLPGFRVMQKRIDRVNEVLREQIGGIRVIRAFVREPHETERFAQANNELTNTGLFVGRWMSVMFPMVLLVMNLSSVAVIWFGGMRVAEGLMEIGSITAFLSYMMQILIAVMMSTMLFMILPRAAVASDRLAEVLDTQPSVKPPARGVTQPTRPRGLTLENVTFAYPGAEQAVVHGVSLSVKPGQTVALIGSTGSGKTTLLKLIPRLFDVSSGSVKLDGVDVRDYDPDVLWGSIGLVPQRGYLFSGTVASNLRFGKPDATDDELWRALEIAQARDFIEELPERLDAPVAQGGTNFSGGQRQRLAIARALVKQPELYLFDDSFSALDVATDARLRAALKPVTKDAMVLVVAQRVATITEADSIVVIEDGRVVGVGAHAELLSTSPTYQEIVASQRQAEAA